MRPNVAYTPRSGDRRKYIAESGVYISTAREYIAGIFGKLFTIAAQKTEDFFWFAMEWPIPSLSVLKAWVGLEQPGSARATYYCYVRRIYCADVM